MLGNVRRIAAVLLFAEIAFSLTAIVGAARSPGVALAGAAAAAGSLIFTAIRPGLSNPVVAANIAIALLQLANLDVSAGLVTPAAVICWIRLGGWMALLQPSIRFSIRVLSGFSVLSLAALLWSAQLAGQLGSAWLSATGLVAAGFVSGMGLACCCAALYADAVQRDAIEAACERQSAALATARAEREEVDRIAWSLHDTVVNTLHAISAGVKAERLRSLRERCADDLAALTRWSSIAADVDSQEFTGTDWLAAAARQRSESLGVQLTRCELSGTCVLPGDVADALAGAVDEALMNVSKHAAGAQVRLTGSFTAEGFAVEVRDTGDGLPPQRRRGGGIDTSIIQRCAQRGIHASVSSGSEQASGPGRGTAVVLRWQRPKPSADAGAANRSAEHRNAWRGDVIELGALAAWKWVLGLCAIAIPLSPSWNSAALRTLGWLLIAIACSGTLSAMKRRSAPIWPWLLATCFAVCAATALYSTGSAVSAAEGDLWAYAPGMLGLIVVAAAGKSVRWLAAAWLIDLATVVGVYAVQGAVADMTPAHVIATANVVPAAALAWAVHRFGRYLDEAADQCDAAAADALEASKQHALARARERRLATVQNIAGPFLTEVASGEADCSDPEVRRRARELERYTRTIASVPAVGEACEDMLMALTEMLFVRGAWLRIGLISADPRGLNPAGLAAAARAAEVAVRNCPPAEAVTVTLMSDEHGGELTLVADSEASPQRAPLTPGAGIAIETETADGQTITVISWKALSAA